VLKPADALEAARNIWAGPRIHEATRLNFIASAVNPRRAYSAYMNQPMNAVGLGHPTVEMPTDAPQVMKNLAWKSRTNFLPLILDTFSQVMKADGYLEANGVPSNAWKYWQSNGLDARQTGIHRAAMQYGASYVTVLPGDTGPVIEGFSPRRMTAIYADPTIDDWPMMALDVNGPMLKLYDEECVYHIGVEKYPLSGLGAQIRIPDGTQWVFLEAKQHGLGFCPVARFRDRMLLDGEEQFGIVEQLIDVQRRVDETTFGMLTAQYYAAFKQRYVIGWVPETEMESLKAEVASFWSFKDDNVKVGEFTETDLTRYIMSKESALDDMAAIAQVSASTLGSAAKGRSNVSAEAVAAMDAGKDRKGSEIKTSFGETWELVLRAAAAIDGDTVAAADTSSQIRWRDMTTISPGAVVDALGKMQSMLGIPAEMLWTRIPGWTDQDQTRAVEIIKSGDSLDKLMVTLSKQQAPPPPASDVPGLDSGGSTVGMGTN
jgi:hypothetical protein